MSAAVAITYAIRQAKLPATRERRPLRIRILPVRTASSAGCSGSVGLAGLLAAHLSGARTIVVEVSASRREAAKELGATHVLDPAGIDAGAAIADLTSGGGTHALDTTGVPAVTATAVKALAPSGIAVVVSLGHPELTLNVRDLLYGGQTLRGCVEGDAVPRTFIPYLLDLYAAGRFPADKLVTTFPLARVNEAVAAGQSGEVVKAVLVPETV